MGIRAGGSALSYSTNDVVSWSGQGTLSESIANFGVNTAGEYYYNFAGLILRRKALSALRVLADFE